MNIHNVSIVCDLYNDSEIKYDLIKYLLTNQYYDFYCKWDNSVKEYYNINIRRETKNIYTVPYGILEGKKSLLGPNCILNIDLFLEEIKVLKLFGIDTNLIKLHSNIKIINDNSINIENVSKKLTYVKDDDRLNNFIFNEKLSGSILCESNGCFDLDVTFGNKFKTNNILLPYGACSLGFPYHKIGSILSFYKLYDNNKNSKVLSKEDEEILNLVKYKNKNINWLNLNDLIKKINMSSCTHIILSDEEFNLPKYKLYLNNDTVVFKRLYEMKMFVSMILRKECLHLIELIFTSSNNKK